MKSNTSQDSEIPIVENEVIEISEIWSDGHICSPWPT